MSRASARICGFLWKLLFEYCAIRLMTSSISSAVYFEVRMRSTVWQLVQPVSARFSASVPGTLRIHSRFESCEARFLAFVGLGAREAGLFTAMGNVDGPARP